MPFKIKKERGPNEKVIQLRINEYHWHKLHKISEKSEVSWQNIIRQMIGHCLDDISEADALTKEEVDALLGPIHSARAIR